VDKNGARKGECDEHKNSERRTDLHHKNLRFDLSSWTGTCITKKKELSSKKERKRKKKQKIGE
jgi:hypothetical protein